MVELLRKLRFGSTHKKFLFLGDYVDRGLHGPECVAYLLALKARFPNQIFLIRGNHETFEQTDQFNFRKQMLINFDEETY